jgi:hypothetical protein
MLNSSNGNVFKILLVSPLFYITYPSCRQKSRLIDALHNVQFSMSTGLGLRISGLVLLSLRKF